MCQKRGRERPVIPVRVLSLWPVPVYWPLWFWRWIPLYWWDWTVPCCILLYPCACVRASVAICSLARTDGWLSCTRRRRCVYLLWYRHSLISLFSKIMNLNKGDWIILCSGVVFSWTTLHFCACTLERFSAISIYSTKNAFYFNKVTWKWWF